MFLGSRNQTVGWVDDRSPTNSLEFRNGGTRSSAHPTLWLKSGSYSEHVPKLSGFEKHDETNAVRFVEAARRLSWFPGCFFGFMFEAVSGTVHRADDSRRLGIDLNSLTKLRNVLVERSAVGEVVLAPRVIENRISIKDPARVSMQQFENLHVTQA
jgi:hypothetical protein